jgi:hypothetical protein
VAWQNSRAARFRRLNSAIRNDDQQLVYGALANWSRSEGFPTISDWITASGDRELAGQISKLEVGLFSVAPGPGLDREGLRRAIARFRKMRPGKGVDYKRPALPELNPS